MCLSVLTEVPHGVAAIGFSQTLSQAFNPMSSQAASHRCPGPKSGYDQRQVIARKSDAVVFHGAYGTIVLKGGQQAS